MKYELLEYKVRVHVCFSWVGNFFFSFNSASKYIYSRSMKPDIYKYPTLTKNQTIQKWGQYVKASVNRSKLFKTPKIHRIRVTKIVPLFHPSLIISDDVYLEKIPNLSPRRKPTNTFNHKNNYPLYLYIGRPLSYSHNINNLYNDLSKPSYSS